MPRIQIGTNFAHGAKGITCSLELRLALSGSGQIRERAIIANCAVLRDSFYHSLILSAAKSLSLSALPRVNTYSRLVTDTASAPCSRRKLASAWTVAGGQCRARISEEVGRPNGDTTPKRALAVSRSFWSQAPKRQRTSRNARARACAAMRSRMFWAISRCAGLHWAAREATRLASERRITP